MSIGKKIKQLRELRNYTQAYMAEELKLSLGGYGKIERDETDISMSRLQKIAEILNTNLSNVLGFESNQVFNQSHNKTAHANGVVQNQQIIGSDKLDEILLDLKQEINNLKNEVKLLKNKN